MFGHDPLSQAGASPSPLAGAALALIADGATPADLAERFAEAGATVEAIEVSVLLGELAGLGLVRIARHNGDHRFHVLTSLGRQVLGGSLGTDAGVVEHLAELERLRTDLLSTIAHELRTPLTAVRTCVGVLRDPATSPSPAEIDTLLDTIERNADRMQRVVGDILEIARFRTGQIFLQLRPFDASALAREAVASLAPLAAKRDQAIELDVPGAPSGSSATTVGWSRPSSTSSPTQSSTAPRVARSPSAFGRSHGPSPGRLRTRGRASHSTSSRTSSSASSSARTIAPAEAAGSGWACRRRSRSPRRTAGPST